MLPAFYILRALQKGTAKGPERVGLNCSASLGKGTTGAGFAPRPTEKETPTAQDAKPGATPGAGANIHLLTIKARKR